MKCQKKCLGLIVECDWAKHKEEGLVFSIHMNINNFAFFPTNSCHLTFLVELVFSPQKFSRIFSLKPVFHIMFVLRLFILNASLVSPLLKMFKIQHKFTSKMLCKSISNENLISHSVCFFNPFDHLNNIRSNLFSPFWSTKQQNFPKEKKFDVNICIAFVKIMRKLNFN